MALSRVQAPQRRRPPRGAMSRLQPGTEHHVRQRRTLLLRRTRSNAARRRYPQQRREGDAGPQGPQCSTSRTATPCITKDGVTVAKAIELEDKFENMGSQMVREVASKTSDRAGDGTTTATVLTASITGEGLKLVAAGMNLMDLKRGIDIAAGAVVRDIERRAKKVQLRGNRPGRHNLGQWRQGGRQDDRRRDEKGRQRGRDHG